MAKGTTGTNGPGDASDKVREAGTLEVESEMAKALEHAAEIRAGLEAMKGELDEMKERSEKFLRQLADYEARIVQPKVSGMGERSQG